MKKTQRSLPTLFSLLFCFYTNITAAQSVAINTDGAAADASALLDVKSTAKGMLIPRMTTAQRTAITTPATGLLVFDTGTNAFWYYNGTAWTKLETPGSNWAITGNSGTSASTHFMGNTDAVDVVFRTSNYERMRLLSTNNAQNVLATISYGDLEVNGITVGRGKNGNSSNTAFGYQALYSNTSGSSNTASGYYALYSNTTGYGNVANGYFSLYSNTTGYYNVADGFNSLYSNTTGASNIANGLSSLYKNTTGIGNTAIGQTSLYSNTTGTLNTAIGLWADVSTGALTNATVIGYNATVNASNKVVIGNTSVTVIGGQVSWSTLSDGRFKTNVKENVPGLDFIMKLRPVNYNFLPRKFDEHLRQNCPDSVKKMAARKADTYSEAENILHTGFIAQEVEQIVKKNGYKFEAVHAPTNPTDNYSISYSEFVVPLVKAMQEQQKLIEEQGKMIEQLKKRLDKLEQH